jgi:glycosyltransferase involved in cell wall biosynthesis
MDKVVVVMPAYNAEGTLEKTVADIPAGAVDEIILVDDGSSDDTVPLARRLGLTVIEHGSNRGYGANQKTCYRAALDRGARIVLMIHPDYQYDTRLVPQFIGLLGAGHCDVILGNRIRSRAEALKGGMPLYKYLANRGLTILENLWLGQNLGEFHSGMRGYRAEVLETLPWERNSNDYVFDSQFLAQSVYFGFRLGDLPVPVRYMGDASSINFTRSLEYGLLTLEVLVRYTLQKLNVLRSPIFQPRS